MLARGSMINVVGMALGAVFGFGLTVLASRWLQPRDSGGLFELIAMYTIMSNILELGADTGLTRWISRARATGGIVQVRRIVRVALLPVVIIGIVAAAVMWVEASWLAQIFLHGMTRAVAVREVRIIAPLVPLGALSNCVLAGPRGYDRMWPYLAIEGVGKPVARLLLVLLALLMGFGLEGALIAWCLPIVAGLIGAWVILGGIIKVELPPARRCVSHAAGRRSGPAGTVGRPGQVYAVPPRGLYPGSAGITSTGPIPRLHRDSPSGPAAGPHRDASTGPIGRLRWDPPTGPIPRVHGSASTGPIPRVRGNSPARPIPRMRGNTSTGPIPRVHGNTSTGPIPRVHGGASTGPIPRVHGNASTGPIRRVHRDAAAGPPSRPHQDPPTVPLPRVRGAGPGQPSGGRPGVPGAYPHQPPRGYPPRPVASVQHPGARTGRHRIPSRVRSSMLQRLASEFWGFAAPRGLAGAFQIVVIWLDVLLVGAMLSRYSAGIYAAVSKLAIVGTYALQGQRLAIGPQLSRLLARRQYRRAEKLFQGGTRMLMLASWPFYLLLMVFPSVVLGIFGPKYMAGGAALAILAGAMLINLGTGNVTVVLLMGGKSSWNALNAFAAVAANIGLNFLLVPRLGIAGAAIAWAASIAIDNIAAVIEVKWSLGLGTFGSGYGLVAIITVICFGLTGVAARVLLGESLLSLVLAGTAGTVVYAAALYTLRTRLQISEFITTLRSRATKKSPVMQPGRQAAKGTQAA